jgi:hypothetical protein
VFFPQMHVSGQSPARAASWFRLAIRSAVSGGMAATVADAPTNRGQQLRFARRLTATPAP